MANGSKIKIDVEVNKSFKQLSGNDGFDKDIKSAKELQQIVDKIAKTLNESNKSNVSQRKSVLNSLRNYYGVETTGKEHPYIVRQTGSQESPNNIVNLLIKAIQSVKNENSNIENEKNQQRRNTAIANDMASMEKFFSNIKDSNTYVHPFQYKQEAFAKSIGKSDSYDLVKRIDKITGNYKLETMSKDELEKLLSDFSKSQSESTEKIYQEMNNNIARKEGKIIDNRLYDTGDINKNVVEKLSNTVENSIKEVKNVTESVKKIDNASFQGLGGQKFNSQNIAAIKNKPNNDIGEYYKSMSRDINIELGKFLLQQKRNVIGAGAEPDMQFMGNIAQLIKDRLNDSLQYVEKGSNNAKFLNSKISSVDTLEKELSNKNFNGEAVKYINEYKNALAESAIAAAEAAKATVKNTDATTRARHKADEAKAESNKRLEKLNKDLGTNYDTSGKSNAYELMDKLRDELLKTIEKLKDLGDVDENDDIGKIRKKNLERERDSYASTLRAVGKSLSTEAFANEQDAMNASMYSSAYSRVYRENIGRSSMSDLQRNYGERLFRELSSLDLKNPIGDALKRSIPILFEDAAHTGLLSIGKSKKNSLFNEYVQETESFKEFSGKYKKDNPSAKLDDILTAFNKDKMRKGKALWEMEALDATDGKGRLSNLSKAGGIFNIIGPVAAKAVSFLAETVKKLGEESIVAYENIQALQTQLGVVFSSQGEANSMFQKFADYAVVSPFGVNTMVQQGIQLKQSGVGGSELLDTMKRIGDISSGNQDKMKSISDVYSRVMASTTVTARDMRQLVNAGVPAYDALTKAMQEKPNGRNVSRSNIRSLLQSGKVTSEDFERMLKNLTDEGGMFYGATKVGAKTLKARKQNLSDIRELSLASLGEKISLLGGTDVDSSFYGKYLKIQEGIWGWLKERGEKGFNVKMIKAGKEKMENYERYSNILDDENISQDLKNAIIKNRQNYGYSEYISAASKWYNSERTRILGDKTLMSSKDANYIESALKKKREIKTYTGNEDSYSYKKLKREIENNPFGKFNENELEALKKNIITQNEYNKKSKKSGFSEFEIADNVVKFAEALTRGSDSIEKFIKATEGATSVITKEKQRYDSTSVGALKKSDEEYAKKQRMKDKMNDFTSTWNPSTKSYDLTMFKSIGDKLSSKDLLVKSGNKNPNGLTMKNYNEVVEYMASDYNRLALSADDLYEKDLYGNITNQISKDAKESWNVLHTNLDVLQKLVENDSTDIGKDIKDSLIGVINNMFDETGKDLSKEGLESISKLNKSLKAEIENIGDVDTRKIYQQALNNTFTNITYDNVRQEDINKSGNPHLWAEALSKLTGIASNRSQLEGASYVMRKFEKTISPKAISKQLMQALISSNTATIKEISDRYMKKNYTGTDFRGNAEYDWEKITDGLAKASKEGNKEARDGYVNALQQQISALDELTVGSLALGETAEEVRSGLTNMGIAFDYSLERGVDGLMYFSDASLEAANKIKSSYQFKMAEAKMNNVKADMMDTQKGKLSSARTEELFSKSIIGSELMTAEELKNVYSELSSKAEELYNMALSEPITKKFYKEETKNVTPKQAYEAKYGSAAKAKEAYEKDKMYSKQTESNRNILDNAYLKNRSETINVTSLSIDNETRELLKSLTVSGNSNKTLYDVARSTDGAEKLTRELAKLNTDPSLSEQDKDKLFDILKKLDVSIDDIVKALPDYNKARRQSEVTTAGNRGLNALKSSFIPKSDEWNIKNSIPNNSNYIPYLNKRIVGLDENAGINERERALANLSEEDVRRLEWLAKEDLITERRASALETGQYDTSVLANRGEKLVNKAYGLDEYVSKMGRTDFFANYISKDLMSMDAKNLSDGDKGLIDTIQSVIAKNPELITKARDKEGNRVGDDVITSVDGLINASDDTSKLENLQNILNGISQTDLTEVISQVEKVSNGIHLQGDKKNTLVELGRNMADTFKSSAISAVPTTMKEIGKEAGNAYVNSKSFAGVWKAANSAMRGILSNLSDQTSQLMMNAGLNMIATPGATKADWAKGFALIAASGLASFVSGMLSATEESDSSNNDELERLNKLKDNMADLLAQARNDAEYYEKELRNKKAISSNMSYTMTSVNDMILTPQGQFSTAPDDFIFAMKHPEDLTRGGAPVINFSVVNNSSSVETRSEQKNNSDGSVDFVTIIDDVVSNGIAQGKYNDAFTLMQSGQNGKQTYA